MNQLLAHYRIDVRHPNVLFFMLATKELVRNDQARSQPTRN